MTPDTTYAIDVSGLRAAIPKIVSFGRRTILEQSVTSAAFISLDAQENTSAVDIGRIDSELEVTVTGYTKGGRVSKAKNPYERRVAVKDTGKEAPLAVLIVMARTDPTSAYSVSTGNRWPLDGGLLPTGKGSQAARQAMVLAWIQQMTMARHSSTHFLQHGWAPAIKTLLNHPAYYAGRSKFKINAQAKINPMNQLSNDQLGLAVVATNGDSCVVSSENDVGEGGNAVLDAKHRAALIREGSMPLQLALDKEERAINTKLQEYIDRGMQAEIGPT